MWKNVEVKKDFRGRKKPNFNQKYGTPEILFQTDTFFNCPQGYLKLREEINQKGKINQLIFYSRSKDMLSTISIANISQNIENVEALKAVLSSAYGVVGAAESGSHGVGAAESGSHGVGIVKKKRELYIYGASEQHCGTRIHWDEVEELGSFLELEVVLKNGESQEYGEDQKQFLLEDLKIEDVPDLKIPYLELGLKQFSTQKEQ